MGVGAGIGIARGVAPAIEAVSRYPALALGTAGVGYFGGKVLLGMGGEESILSDNPYGDLTDTQMNTRLNQEMGAAALLQESSVMPMGRTTPARRMLMNSTNGLVQGMHRGRHRG